MNQSAVTMTKERDVRPHASFWHTSRCLLERGKASLPSEFMASLVFTAFTFEAYLNWLGTQIFRHWSYLERLNPKEELQLIADHLEVKIDNGKLPMVNH